MSAVDALALLRDDTEISRCRLYVRMLYAPSTVELIRGVLADGGDVAVPSRTREVLATVDWDLLAIEQGGRARNLRKFLLRSCPSLGVVFDDDELLDLARGFADDDAFWAPRGRTLAENFCLQAYEALGPAPSLRRDVVRLCGTLSGLTGAPDDPSPWLAPGVTPPRVRGVRAADAFRSSWRLVDERGLLPAPENLDVVSEPGDWHLLVARLTDDRLFATATRLAPG